MVRAPLDVPNATAAVAAALKRPSHCVPVGGVMLSMANPHHQPLRVAQFARIQHVKCLMNRLVSICWGFGDDGFGTCVKGECKLAPNGKMSKDSACVPSDYRRSQYVSLNWAKWPFFIDALRVARVILWIEADVVIGRNPWEGLAGIPGVDAPWLVRPNSVPTPDVQYQWEAPPCNGSSWPSRDDVSWVKESGVVCHRRGWHAEPLNCGQLLITSLAFAQTVWDSRPAQFMNGDKSQQYYANVAKHNFSHGGLPLDYYNYCWRKEVSIVNKCRVATMHATCGQSSSDKGRLMHSFVKTFSGCALSNRTGRPLSPEAAIREELKFE
jgi:hypothetical protein